jgi:hypothetical protein
VKQCKISFFDISKCSLYKIPLFFVKPERSEPMDSKNLELPRTAFSDEGRPDEARAGDAGVLGAQNVRDVAPQGASAEYILHDGPPYGTDNAWAIRSTRYSRISL